VWCRTWRRLAAAIGLHARCYNHRQTAYQQTPAHQQQKAGVAAFLLRVNSDVQGCAKLAFPHSARVLHCSFAPPPSHGPLLFALANPPKVIPCQSTSTLVTVPSSTSSNHPAAATSPQPIHSFCNCFPGTKRGETRNAFRAIHDRRAPNAPCFEFSKRASLSESTAELLHACQLSIDSTTPKPHRNTTPARLLPRPRPNRLRRLSPVNTRPEPYAANERPHHGPCMSAPFCV
jgi:hypothetical protein